jgi:hypothetical protein
MTSRRLGITGMGVLLVVLALLVWLALQPAASPGRAPVAAASASPSGPPPECTPANTATTLSTDHPSYTVGQTVRFTTTVRNTSHIPCVLAVGDSSPNWLMVRLPDGKVVDDWCSTYACPPPSGSRLLQPGETVTAYRTWDQRVCEGSNCSGGVIGPGTFRPHAYWYHLSEASLNFNVNPG